MRIPSIPLTQNTYQSQLTGTSNHAYPSPTQTKLSTQLTLLSTQQQTTQNQNQSSGILDAMSHIALVSFIVLRGAVESLAQLFDWLLDSGDDAFDTVNAISDILSFDINPTFDIDPTDLFSIF